MIEHRLDTCGRCGSLSDDIVWNPYVPLCPMCKRQDEGRHAILQIREGGHAYYGGYDLYEWRAVAEQVKDGVYTCRRAWVHINCPQWFTTTEQVVAYAKRTFKAHTFREGIEP